MGRSIHMRNQLVVLLAGLLLAGCGAPSAPAESAAQPAQQSAVEAAAGTEVVAEGATETTAETATEQAGASDLAALPRDVDVQTAAALAERSDVVILDVREQDEWDAGHIPGAIFIPMSEIQSRLAEVPQDKTVIVQCRSGNRSSQVTDFLQQQGFTNIHNMAGGLNAWQGAGLPVEK